MCDPVEFFRNSLRSGSGSALQNPVGSQSGNECQAKFLTCEISNLTPYAQPMHKVMLHTSNTLRKLMISA